jgi:hypothetical protein
MRRLLISAVGLTTVTAVLLSSQTELTAADRGARDRASNARDAANSARDAARDHASAARDAANSARDAARDRASAARDAANAARDAARDHASAARDAASAARGEAHDRASAARDMASAAVDQARGSVSDDDRVVIDELDREVFVDRNGGRSYTSLGAWIEDLQRSWSGTESERSGRELSAQTSVAVGNAVSRQTARTSTSGGEASISLSTTVRVTEDGRSVTRVQRASANATVE